MRVPRFHRNCLLTCSFLLCGFITIYQFSNVFDLVLFSISQGPDDLSLTLHCNLGRLGNQMCTYATLYGLSNLNRRSFVSLTCNKKHLKKIFIGPAKVQSVDNFLYLRSNPWNLLPYLRSEDYTIPHNCNFIQGYRYPCSYTFFDHVKDEIRKEFQFQDHLRQHAQSILLKANAHNFSRPTYVGVHVRRGDYNERWLKVFDGVPVNMEYFQKALKHFRDNYKNVIFVAISEDRLWCIKKLASDYGVYVPEEAPSAAHDLAVLASCNHTVMTYGTFGFWGAYLAGGEVLYFDKFLKPNTTFTSEKFIFEKMYPPHWKGIVTIKHSYWLKNTESPSKAAIKNHTVNS